MNEIFTKEIIRINKTSYVCTKKISCMHELNEINKFIF